MSEPTATPGLVREFEVREGEAAVSLIVDIIERMERAHKTVLEMSAADQRPEEEERLLNKASGIALCLSYAREALRT